MFMQRNVAYLLLIIMLGLIALGLVMLSSTSAVLAPQDMTGVYSNLRKQMRLARSSAESPAFFSRATITKSCCASRPGCSGSPACCWCFA